MLQLVEASWRLGIALMRFLVAIAVGVFAPLEIGADGIFVLVIETR